MKRNTTELLIYKFVIDKKKWSGAAKSIIRILYEIE